MSKLYVNRTKNEFANLEMDFLGHVLVKERVKPNPIRSKVWVVLKVSQLL